jgi:hypothetical protein
MNELGEQIVSELDRRLGQLHEPITPHAMAQRVARKRPDLVEHLTDAEGEAIEAVVIEALGRPPQRTTRNLPVEGGKFLLDSLRRFDHHLENGPESPTRSRS